jgi:hypothetical protein
MRWKCWFGRHYWLTLQGAVRLCLRCKRRQFWGAMTERWIEENR